jgi:hypothetical protein
MELDKPWRRIKSPVDRGFTTTRRSGAPRRGISGTKWTGARVVGDRANRPPTGRGVECTRTRARGIAARSRYPGLADYD